jgi:hypothetical protein
MGTSHGDGAFGWYELRDTDTEPATGTVTLAGMCYGMYDTGYEIWDTCLIYELQVVSYELRDACYEKTNIYNHASMYNKLSCIPSVLIIESSSCAAAIR